jgi:hypothetical protein
MIIESTLAKQLQVYFLFFTSFFRENRVKIKL